MEKRLEKEKKHMCLKIKQKFQGICKRSKLPEFKSGSMFSEKKANWAVSTRIVIKSICSPRGNCSNLLSLSSLLSLDVAQGRLNGAPNETRTHCCSFAS